MRARNDLGLYERGTASWWGGDAAEFRSLRSVGRFHLGLMQREWGARLRGARLVELGCGGGYLSLSLAELGADVTALDRSGEAVRAARSEASRRGLDCDFVRADVYAAPLPTGSADLVVMGDVLEHLEEPGRALAEAGRLLREGGRLFVSSFERGWRSSLLVVWLAEGLGLVPRGTHDPRLFLRVEDLSHLARAADLDLERLVWERPRLWETLRSRTIRLEEGARGLGFSAFFTKVAA